MRRDTDCLLTSRGVDDKECFLRLQKSFELLKLLDQRDLDFLPAGGLEDVDVASSPILPFERCGCRTLEIFLVRIRHENWNVDLFSERRELFDRCWSLQVQCDQIRSATLFLQKPSEFRGRSCFAGTVQPDDQNSARFAEVESGSCRIAAKQDRQFVVKNFNDLLTGRDAAQNCFAERFFFYSGDK